MTDIDGSGRAERGPGVTRFGLSRTELAAAIVAELDQSADGHEPEAIAAAVAAAIEANNEQLLRHLRHLLGPGDQGSQ